MMASDRLRAFLHDVQRGCAKRYGYARVSVWWVNVPATKSQRADLEAAFRLGLAHWPSLVPGTAAELTDSGRQLLGKPDPAIARYEWIRDPENVEAAHLVATYGGEDLDARIDSYREAIK